MQLSNPGELNYEFFRKLNKYTYLMLDLKTYSICKYNHIDKEDVELMQMWEIYQLGSDAKYFDLRRLFYPYPCKH